MKICYDKNGSVNSETFKNIIVVVLLIDNMTDFVWLRLFFFFYFFFLELSLYRSVIHI